MSESTNDLPENNLSAPCNMIKQTFAKRSSIFQKNGKLYYCFNPDFSAACEETKVTSIQLSAIEFSQYVNECSDGSAIDIITYN